MESDSTIMGSYARAFEAGGLAACEYIAEQWPHLSEPSDDFPGLPEAVAEHIAFVAQAIRDTA